MWRVVVARLMGNGGSAVAKGSRAVVDVTGGHKPLPLRVLSCPYGMMRGIRGLMGMGPGSAPPVTNSSVASLRTPHRRDRYLVCRRAHGEAGGRAGMAATA